MSITLVTLTEVAAKLKHKMEEDPEGWKESFDTIEGQIKDKLIAYGIICRNIEAEAKVYKDESDRLAKKYKSMMNQVEFLMQRAEQAAKENDIEDVKQGVITGKWRKLTDMVIVDNLEDIPEEFKRHIPESWEAEKKVIKESYEKGVPVAGTHLDKDRKKWEYK